MSTAAPAAPQPLPASPRGRHPRPVLNLRVLRGLEWLVLYGWGRIDGMSAEQVAEIGIPEADVLYARRWVERMTAYKKGTKS